MYIIVAKGFQNIQKVQKFTFFPFIFLNVNSSFTMKNKLLNFSVTIVHMVMQGTVSQIFYLCCSFCFM